MSRAAPAFLAAILLAGCASGPEFQYSRDVLPVTATARPAPRGEITVVWEFGPPEWVSRMCNQRDDRVVHGCAMLSQAGDRCLIFVVPPDGFQDRDRLAVIGHEFWHCQGARHG